jgi:hypothetical protein
MLSMRFKIASRRSSSLESAMDKPEDIDPVAVTLMAVTLQGYGNFLATWSTYEIVVEILIMRELGIKPEQASIVCAGRAVDVKLNMLQALMGERAKGHAGLTALIKAREEAERNTFAHGFFRTNREHGDLFLISREVKRGYKAWSKHLNYETMDHHLGKFLDLYLEAKRLFGVKDDDIEAYTQPIEALALAQAAEEERRHRESQANSGKAKREQPSKEGR